MALSGPEPLPLPPSEELLLMPPSGPASLPDAVDSSSGPPSVGAAPPFVEEHATMPPHATLRRTPRTRERRLMTERAYRRMSAFASTATQGASPGSWPPVDAGRCREHLLDGPLDSTRARASMA